MKPYDHREVAAAVHTLREQLRQTEGELAEVEAWYRRLDDVAPDDVIEAFFSTTERAMTIFRQLEGAHSECYCTILRTLGLLPALDGL